MTNLKSCEKCGCLENTHPVKWATGYCDVFVPAPLAKCEHERTPGFYSNWKGDFKRKDEVAVCPFCPAPKAPAGCPDCGTLQKGAHTCVVKDKAQSRETTLSELEIFTCLKNEYYKYSELTGDQLFLKLAKAVYALAANAQTPSEPQAEPETATRASILAHEEWKRKRFEAMERVVEAARELRKVDGSHDVYDAIKNFEWGRKLDKAIKDLDATGKDEKENKHGA